MTETFGGKCVGGPYADRLTTYYARTIKITMADHPVLQMLHSTYRDGVYTWDEVDEVWQWQT